MRRWITRIIILLFVVAIGWGATKWYSGRGDRQNAGFQTAPIRRGDILQAINATGTLEPDQVIDVGAQVAGQIISFGKDANGKTIDYGSPVEEDMVLANIDDSLYKADFQSATAALASANAGVDRAIADLGTMKAKLVQSQNDWERAQKLGSSEALSQTSYDQYQETYETAKANVAVDVAAIEEAKGSVASAEAALLRAQRNLDYCVIKSPVKGVIVDRRVNTGQTVVSSLNTPSLFLIASDLKTMQVWVAVNEADIGNIHPSQPVTFTVDTYPGRTFHGVVGKVRLNAQMTQNVVTYTVEINTENPDYKLLPYLTANVAFEVSRKEDVLMVPNAALRFVPSSPDEVVPEARAAMEQQDNNSGGGGGVGGGEAAPASQPSTTQPDHQARTGGRRGGTIWIQQDDLLKPIHVRTGATDGIDTEVSGDDLTEGALVVTGEAFSDAGGDQTRNPFMPQFGNGRRPQSGGSGGAGGGGAGGGGGARRGS
jgi:HlyD family secretion protein